MGMTTGWEALHGTGDYATAGWRVPKAATHEWPRMPSTFRLDSRPTHVGISAGGAASGWAGSRPGQRS